MIVLYLEPMWYYFGLLGWPGDAGARVVPPSVAWRWRKDTPRWVCWVFLSGWGLIPPGCPNISGRGWEILRPLGSELPRQGWVSFAGSTSCLLQNRSIRLCREGECFPRLLVFDITPNPFPLPKESGSLDIVRGTPVQSREVMSLPQLPSFVRLGIRKHQASAG